MKELWYEAVITFAREKYKMANVVYLKGARNVEVQKRRLTLGDLVMLECSDMKLANKLKVLKVLNIPEQETRMVVSILEIIAQIHKEYPGIEIQNLGEKDIIVTYENKTSSPIYWHWLKAVFVVLITFVGSAFSVMTFHHDVGVSDLFAQIYEFTMGTPSDGFTLLEAAYSIGLVIGILVFFNHFGGKRFSVDPTPIEVEMRLYENDLQTTLIETYSRKGKELDVDQTDSAGSYRN